MMAPTFVRRPDGRAEPIEFWLDRNLEERRAKRPKRSTGARKGWGTRWADAYRRALAMFGGN
jgi:hypothetical protein